MNTQKIAISIPKNILQNIDLIAKKHKISRSKIISKGAELIMNEFQRKNIVKTYEKIFSDPKIRKEQIKMSEDFLSSTHTLDEY